MFSNKEKHQIGQALVAFENVKAIFEKYWPADKADAGSNEPPRQQQLKDFCPLVESEVVKQAREALIKWRSGWNLSHKELAEQLKDETTYVGSKWPQKYQPLGSKSLHCLETGKSFFKWHEDRHEWRQSVRDAKCQALIETLR